MATGNIQQQLLDATFRRLVGRLEALGIPASSIQAIQSELDRISLLVGSKAGQQSSTFSLLEPVDWVLELLDSLSSNIRVQFDPTREFLVTENPWRIRRALYSALVSLDGAAMSTIRISPPGGNSPAYISVTADDQQIENISIPRTLSRPANGCFDNITALVIVDCPAQRETLFNRLSLLGLRCVTRLDAGLPDVCLVSDIQGSAYRSVAPLLHEVPVLLVNCHRLVRDVQATPIAGPLTQHALTSVLTALLQQTRHHRRTLIVDDNPANTLLLQSQLREADHEVDVAESGEAAVSAVQQTGYDIVFMDLQMPNMNGIEATRRIRQLGFGNAIYGLTAHTSVEEKTACLQAGMDDVLIKPVRLERLSGILQQSAEAEKGHGASPQQRHELPVFDRQLALHAANERIDIAKEMLSLLVETLPEDIARLNAAKDELPLLAQCCHSLLGSLRFCGTPRLLAAVERLETVLKSEESVTPDSLLQAINSEATAVLTWYRDNDDIFSETQ